MTGRPASIALAYAPVAVLLCWTLGTALAGPLAGPLAANLVLLAAVAAFTFASDPDRPPQSTIILRIAVASFVLLLPATAMHLAPRHLVNPDPAAPVTLRPTRYETPIKNAVDVTGLSTRYEPAVEHWDPADRVPWQFRVKLWINSGSPPCRLDDGQGNWIDCTLPAANSLHFRDARGGTADVNWDGTKFTLTAGHPAGRSDSARGPTPAALQLQKLGDGLLTLIPLLAWLLITWSAHHREHQLGRSTAALTLAAVLQLIAAATLTWLTILWSPRQGDETNVITFLFCALLCLATLGPAWSILGYHLTRRHPARPHSRPRPSLNV